jgi:DNA-binding SARP family transcriptional activator
VKKLSLAFLGVPEVRLADNRVVFPTRKALGLLAYLAVEGGVHGREKLAALFWPASDNERGRATLRRTLSFLREHLGDQCLIVEQDLLGFNFAGEVEVDVQILAAAARTQQIAALQQGAQRYRGDFLEGLVLADAPDFEVWLSQRRAYYHQCAGQLFARLVSEELAQGQQNEAKHHATRWLTLDELNEAAYGKLMEAQFATGDRAAALRTYETCHAMLAKEFNISPSAEMAALVERVRSDKGTRRQGDPARASKEQDEQSKIQNRSTEAHERLKSKNPPFPPPLVTAFVGRNEEHTQLVKAFFAARRGQTQAVIVCGESGIGKTRLVQEFAQWARGQGAELLVGQAFETGGRLPFQPLTDALRAALEVENAPDDLLADLWLVELSHLLPELRERYPDLPNPTPAGPGDAARLFEAIARLGQALAARAPLLLLIDDLQWADAASLDLIHYLARRWRAAQTPALLLGTVRSEALTEAPAMTAWLTNLQRELPVTTLTLAALSSAATQQLLHHLTQPSSQHATLSQGDFSAQPVDFGLFADWLWGETQGHPLFIGLTLKTLLEQGQMQQVMTPQGDWQLDLRGWSLAAMRNFLPDSIQGLIASRLRRLTPRTKAFLTAAAVLGHSFTFAQLQQTAELPEAETLDALEEAQSAQLLIESRDGIYSFHHDKIRQVAYTQTSTARRRILHRRALEQLTATAAPAELARHAIATHLPAPAYRYSVEAGDSALRLFAVRDAVLHYTTALAYLPSDPAHCFSIATLGLETGLQSFEHLFIQLGRSYELLGERSQAQAIYEQLLASAQTHALEQLECIALNHLATLAAGDLSDLGRAKTLLQQAAQAAERVNDLATLVDMEWNLAQMAIYQTEPVLSRQHGQRALALARQLGGEERVARSLNQLAFAECAWGNLPVAATYAAEAHTLYATLGDQAMLADSLCLLADAQTRLGQAAAGVESAKAAEAISLKIENVWGQANSKVRLALAYLDLGDLPTAQVAAEAGVTLARTHQILPLLILNLTVLGIIQRSDQKPLQALKLHQEALEISQMIGYVYFQAMTLLELCADSGAAGDWSTAYGQAVQTLFLQPPDVLLFPGFSHWALVEALVRKGDLSAAQQATTSFAVLAVDNPRYHRVHQRNLALLAGQG